MAELGVTQEQAERLLRGELSHRDPEMLEILAPGDPITQHAIRHGPTIDPDR